MIGAGRTASIPIKAPKGGILKNLNYIFKPSEFKLGHREGFIAAVMNNETAYILTINNINHDVIIPRHQYLGKVSISIIKGCYQALIEDKYLINRLILIKKGLTVVAALLIMPII